MTIDSILYEIEHLPRYKLREYANDLMNLNDHEQPDHQIPKPKMEEYLMEIFTRIHGYDCAKPNYKARGD